MKAQAGKRKEMNIGKYLEVIYFKHFNWFEVEHALN
jgi:hypothetical protein